MKAEIILTIRERHRENTENVRIIGHTPEGEEYTFHILGENAWWFESFLKVGTQVILRPLEAYVIYTGNPQEQMVRIPPENNIHIRLEKASSE